jgi:hypothetical protein
LCAGLQKAEPTVIARILVIVGWISAIFCFFPIMDMGCKWLFGYSSPQEYRDLRPSFLFHFGVWFAAILLVMLAVSIWQNCVQFIFALFVSGKPIRLNALLMILILFVLSLPGPILMFLGATQFGQWSPIGTIIGIMAAMTGVAWYQIIQEFKEPTSIDDESSPEQTTLRE